MYIDFTTFLLKKSNLEGPVFTNILLADEINRATPRTQSSLLECMAECQVTVDGETRVLEPPFFVIATQNPVETIGCFPLPEAQLDRFIMKISMGSLSASEERQMLDRFINAEPLANLDSAAKSNLVTSFLPIITFATFSSIFDSMLISSINMFPPFVCRA